MESCCYRTLCGIGTTSDFFDFGIPHDGRILYRTILIVKSMWLRVVDPCVETYDSRERYAESVLTTHDSRVECRNDRVGRKIRGYMNIGCQWTMVNVRTRIYIYIYPTT